MSVDEEKRRLREDLLAARRARPAGDLERLRAAVREQVVGRCAGLRAVAAYVPLGGEPGSVELLEALTAAGTVVLVPVTLTDRDLDWAVWTPAGHADLQGLDAIGRAELVFVPALAVATSDGTRLGRGGGSYDRALGRVRNGTPVAALVFTDEVVPELPRDSWDVPVSAAVTPDGWVPLAE
ncbi:MAG TPA: 5-formyltetrahydrofolate cyclo-ligase [Jatrophihabitans sp.]|nr:5-formyltetrahydrofolate cyclo-ligase [Jatrophihabitans sp.]